MKLTKLLTFSTLCVLLVLSACTNPSIDNKDNFNVVLEKKKAATQQAVDPSAGVESYNEISENKFHEASKEKLSTFSIDVDNASYSNTRRYLMDQSSLPPKDAVRIEEFINYFNYDYPTPERGHPFTVTTEVSECPWAPGNKLVHIGLKGREVAKSNMPASNLVFLIDVSGSMNNARKLPLLKDAFNILVKQLRPQDKVAIVTYAGASGLVLPSTSGAEQRMIRNAIQEMQSGGSTAGAAGILMAYQEAEKNFIKGGNNRVILATDGDFNVGISNQGELVKLIEEKRKSGVYLSTLGFGTGNLKDGRLEQIADNGNGNYFYIDNIDEGHKVFSKELTSTILAIAKDVKLQVEFNDQYVKEYRLVGYENRVLKNEDFNNDEKDAGDMGAGHTVTAMYEIVPVAGYTTASTTNVAPDRDNQPEFLNIKLRYKRPNSDRSTLFSHSVADNGTKLDETSDNYRFSASVASFGMLLRDSDFKGTATYSSVEEMATKSKGKDLNGYRDEFIRMVQVASSFASKPAEVAK